MSEPRFSYRSGEGDTSILSNTPSSKLKLRRLGMRSALTVTDNFVAKKFGPQMPLTVAECLAKSFGAKESSSVGVSEECGWSWLVCGRRLFAWPLSEEEGGVPDEEATVVGKDLSLPASDLTYSAHLALVFKSPSRQTVSCVAVSPEGVVRYWHTLRHFSSWIDVNSQLGGEEVYCLVELGCVGIVAVTTSGSLLLIAPPERDGETVSVSLVSDKRGWLGGLGKRFSALLGYQPTPTFIESKGMRVSSEEVEEGCWRVRLLADQTLQTWELTVDSGHRLLSETSLRDTVAAAFNYTNDQESDVSWEILDMKSYDQEYFMILVGSAKLKTLVIMKVSCDEGSSEGGAVPLEVVSLSVQDYRCLTAAASPGSSAPRDPLSSLRLLPASSPNHCFVYSNRLVLALTLDKVAEGGGSDVVQFHNGYFLGGALYRGTPVFFSTVHSFVSVAPLSPLHQLQSSPNTSLMMEGGGDAVRVGGGGLLSSESDDNVYNEAVKDSLLLHTKKNLSQARAVIASKFSESRGVDNSPLVRAVVAVSDEIINQSSSRDPRAASKPGNFSEVSSLQLNKQMCQKEAVHASYVLFVEEIVSPQNLGRASFEGQLCPVMSILYDHHERIVAARALYELKSKYQSCVSQAVSRVASRCNFPMEGAMNISEYFFTQVKYIYEGLKELCCLPEMKQMEEGSYDGYLQCVSDVNNILIEVLTKVIKTSEKKQFLNDERNYIESLASGSGLFESLMNQAKRTAVIGTQYEKMFENVGGFMDQLFSLSDIILFTQRNHASAQDFNSLSASLINYFVDSKMYQQALMLGEKFSHYPTLVKICFLTADVSRLNTYLDKYGDSGFCEELFKFYASSRMFPQLMRLPLSTRYEERLSQFLVDQPDVSWMYAALRGDYHRTYRTLLHLGSLNNDFALRKTRILSVAKLLREVCAEEDKELDTKLLLLSVQDELPKSLLANVGFANKPPRAFTPAELIQLLVCRENTEADEHHYKKALDLLPTLSDHEQSQQLWELIWQRALIVDRYVHQELGAPEQAVDKMLLFRLIKLIILTDEKPESVIPSYQTLVSLPELKDVSNDQQLEHLLKFGYEIHCESAGIHVSDL